MAFEKVQYLIFFSLSFALCIGGDPCVQKWWPKAPKAAANWKGDWTKTDPSRRLTTVKTEDDPSKSYAYCAAAIVEAHYAEKGAKGRIVDFSAQQIYNALAKKSGVKDVAAALAYIKNTPLRLWAAEEGKDKKAALQNQGIDDFCSKSFNENDIKRIVSLKPACVELSVPQSFLSLNKEVYDCNDIKASDAKIKYHALLYGFDATTYFIKASRGTKWGSSGFAKLKNAAKCGITAKVTYNVIFS